MVDATPLLPGLSAVQGKVIVARFDGGRLSSEGGLLALREIERRLGLADRHAAQRVAQRIGVSRPTVWRWQQRFAESGVDGLLRDKTRKPGKPPIAAETTARVVA